MQRMWNMKKGSREGISQEKKDRRDKERRIFIANLVRDGILSPEAAAKSFQAEVERTRSPAVAHLNDMNARGDHPHPLLGNPSTEDADLPSETPTDRDLLSNCMISPYRDYSKGVKAYPGYIPRPIHHPEFSKELLIEWCHHKEVLIIDLFRPITVQPLIPLEHLTPLVAFRHLTYLEISNMRQSYQSIIWKAVWLNPQLWGLSLTMRGAPAALEKTTIEEGRGYASTVPTMRAVARKEDTAAPPEKLPMKELRLNNFIVDAFPFEWFDASKLRLLCFAHCYASRFNLPLEMQDSVEVKTMGPLF